MTAPAAPPARTGGFTLVEVLVTMVLLTITLLALAPLTLRVAQMSSQATIATQRTAVLSGEVQRLELTDFASLSAGTTCTTFSAADFPHTKCVTVTVVDATTKRITVTITPLNGGPPDTTIIERYKGGRTNPLKP